jgi:F0F1-type ATP synthase membrane subunit b/b'
VPLAANALAHDRRSDAARQSEHALQRLGREGEAAVGDVTREVASFAERIAQKLREAADRKDERGPGEPPAQGG